VVIVIRPREGWPLPELSARRDSAMQACAILSPCRRYRFALWRRWDPGPQVLFILLNPSTADESSDDPTVRRCIGFAKAWGFGAVAISNLFAFRTPYPALPPACPHPVGPENDAWLDRLHEESSLTVAAWGNHGRLLGRGTVVQQMLPGLQILGLTIHAEPRHPLYVRAGASAHPWSTAIDRLQSRLGR
jgi:hypothetical protein